MASVFVGSPQDKQSWLEALRHAQESSRAQTESLKPTTIRANRRRSLQASSGPPSRRMSTTSESLSESIVIDAENYSLPVFTVGKPPENCAECNKHFSLFSPAHRCLLSCGQFYCHSCCSNVSFQYCFNPIVIGIIELALSLFRSSSSRTVLETSPSNKANPEELAMPVFEVHSSTLRALHPEHHL